MITQFQLRNFTMPGLQCNVQTGRFSDILCGMCIIWTAWLEFLMQPPWTFWLSFLVFFLRENCSNWFCKNLNKPLKMYEDRAVFSLDSLLSFMIKICCPQYISLAPANRHGLRELPSQKSSRFLPLWYSRQTLLLWGRPKTRCGDLLSTVWVPPKTHYTLRRLLSWQFTRWFINLTVNGCVKCPLRIFHRCRIGLFLHYIWIKQYLRLGWVGVQYTWAYPPLFKIGTCCRLRMLPRPNCGEKNILSPFRPGTVDKKKKSLSPFPLGIPNKAATTILWLNCLGIPNLLWLSTLPEDPLYCGHHRNLYYHPSETRYGHIRNLNFFWGLEKQAAGPLNTLQELTETSFRLP